MWLNILGAGKSWGVGIPLFFFSTHSWTPVRYWTWLFLLLFCPWLLQTHVKQVKTFPAEELICENISHKPLLHRSGTTLLGVPINAFKLLWLKQFLVANNELCCGRSCTQGGQFASCSGPVLSCLKRFVVAVGWLLLCPLCLPEPGQEAQDICLRTHRHRSVGGLGGLCQYW